MSQNRKSWKYDPLDYQAWCLQCQPALPPSLNCIVSRSLVHGESIKEAMLQKGLEAGQINKSSHLMEGGQLPPVVPLIDALTTSRVRASESVGQCMNPSDVQNTGYLCQTKLGGEEDTMSDMKVKQIYPSLWPPD